MAESPRRRASIRASRREWGANDCDACAYASHPATRGGAEAEVDHERDVFHHTHYHHLRLFLYRPSSDQAEPFQCGVRPREQPYEHGLLGDLDVHQLLPHG